MPHDPIYLDHAASSRLRPEAWEAMRPLFSELIGNPSSPHRDGQRARRELQNARRLVARSLSVSHEQVAFVGNGSEANLLALQGACHSLDEDLRHVLVSAIEHPSVLQPLRDLHARGVIELELLRVDAEARLDLDHLRQRLRPTTGLVSVMVANNEVGTIQPIKQILEELASRPTLFHSDATQAIGRLPVDFVSSTDLVTMSAHKFGGPRGVGVLVRSSRARLSTPLSPGRQESGLRGGTEDVISCVGAAVALQHAVEQQQEEALRLRTMSETLRERLTHDERIAFHSPMQGCLPGFSNFSVRDRPGAHMVAALDQHGVSISHGSACSSLAALPSHVLEAMGAKQHASSALRVSFGHDSRFEEVEDFVQRLRVVVDTPRKSSKSQNRPKR